MSKRQGPESARDRSPLSKQLELESTALYFECPVEQAPNRAVVPDQCDAKQGRVPGPNST